MSTTDLTEAVTFIRYQRKRPISAITVGGAARSRHYANSSNLLNETKDTYVNAVATGGLYAKHS